MNKQLLRLKQRSNSDILQVAESDDSNNLYVNVADGKLDVGTIDEVTNVTDVDSVNLVDEVTNITSVDTVDNVTEVHKAVLYGTDPDGIERPVLINDEGQLDTTRMQCGDIVTEGYMTFPAAAAQYTTLFADYTNPDNETYDTYMFYITNPTQSALTLSVRNANVNSAGINAYHEIATKTIAAATYTTPTTDAWSSCFTSIGGVLADKSSDWSDNVPPATGDVTFAFGAVNDAIYFGHTAQFRIVVPIVGTAGNYTATFVWEYWNGSSWELLPSIVASTGTAAAPFKTLGATIYKWTTPADWTAYDIPSDPLSRYWVRARISNYTSKVTTPVFINGLYLLSRNVISHAYKLDEGVFNSGGITRFVVSNDTALTATQALPVYYTLRKF